MKAYLSKTRIALALILVLIVCVFLGPIFAQTVVAATENPVTAAWNKVLATGSYHFASDITQITNPLPTLANVGQRSRTEKMRLEGENNLHSQRLEMTLWSEGGNVLQAESGLGVRIEQGKAFARRGTGARGRGSRASRLPAGPRGRSSQCRPCCASSGR